MAKRHITIPMHEDQAELLSQLAMENGESLAAYVRGRILSKRGQRHYLTGGHGLG